MDIIIRGPTSCSASLVKAPEWWTEKFPPMPTECAYTAALCTGTALVVVGGTDNKPRLKTVARSPQSISNDPNDGSGRSGAVCHCPVSVFIYLLGGFSKENATNSVSFCSLHSLLSSIGPKSLGEHLVSTLTLVLSNKGSWTKTVLADLPVVLPAAVSLHGQLLAINWWDRFKRQTHHSRSYVPAIH